MSGGDAGLSVEQSRAGLEVFDVFASLPNGEGWKFYKLATDKQVWETLMFSISGIEAIPGTAKLISFVSAPPTLRISAKVHPKITRMKLLSSFSGKSLLGHYGEGKINQILHNRQAHFCCCLFPPTVQLLIFGFCPLVPM